MISIVLDICKNFLDFIQKKEEIKKEKKEKISEFFKEISTILQDTADKLKRDEYPHGNCLVMEKIGFGLKKELIGVIPDEDLEELISSLLDASRLEKQYSLRKEPDTISEIEIVSGEFLSMSLLLKIN